MHPPKQFSEAKKEDVETLLGLSRAKDVTIMEDWHAATTSNFKAVSFALVAGRGSDHSNWRAQTQIGAPTKRWLQKQTQISFEGEPLNKLVSALGGAQNQATLPKPQLPIFRIGRANGLCILNRPMPRHMGGSAPCVSLSSRSTETSPTAGPHFKGFRKQVNLKSTLLEASLPKGDVTASIRL